MGCRATAALCCFHCAHVAPITPSRPFLLTMSSTYNGRPTTARSTRPGTARPQTGISTVYQEGSFIIALLEGRGVSREVGLAALNKDTGEVNLVQVLTLCIDFNRGSQTRRLQTVRHTSRPCTRCICITLPPYSSQTLFSPRRTRLSRLQARGAPLRVSLLSISEKSFLRARSSPSRASIGTTAAVNTH